MRVYACSVQELDYLSPGNVPSRYSGGSAPGYLHNAKSFKWLLAGCCTHHLWLVWLYKVRAKQQSYMTDIFMVA